MAKVATLRYILSLCFFSIFIYSPVAHEAIRHTPNNVHDVVYSFADIVEQSSPSVVNIYAKRRAKTNVPLFNDPFFKQFFRGLGLRTERQENSLGSGVVIDSSGLIISNLHVLQGAEDIVVVTHDRREYQADIVLEDDKTDLAAIRLRDFHGYLPSLDFGDAYQTRVGDLVLAIGNPFGVSQTVTSGIVSGLARTQVNENRFQSYIQTDAAINPGNSGGALINMQGQLLGINTAIISPTGSSSGLGFATPVNMLKPIVYAVKNNVPLNRAWLGFDAQFVDSTIAEALDLEFPHGALVGTVLPDSPADKAGLKNGDLIIAANDNLIETPSNLHFLVASLVPEETPSIRLTIHGQPNRKIIFPINFPPVIPAMNRQVIEGRSILSGADVTNISPFIIEYHNLPLTSKGVLVVQIFNGSPAAQLGFQTGDILVSLNDESIDNVAKLKGMISKKPDQWDIVVQRQGRQQSWSLR